MHYVCCFRSVTQILSELLLTCHLLKITYGSTRFWWKWRNVGMIANVVCCFKGHLRPLDVQTSCSCSANTHTWLDLTCRGLRRSRCVLWNRVSFVQSKIVTLKCWNHTAWLVAKHTYEWSSSDVYTSYVLKWWYTNDSETPLEMFHAKEKQKTKLLPHKILNDLGVRFDDECCKAQHMLLHKQWYLCKAIIYSWTYNFNFAWGSDDANLGT